MDVLCTDKTGTLTQGKIVLEKHLDVHGDPSEKVLHYGYLNSYHHTGLKNLLDEAILDHEELEERLKATRSTARSTRSLSTSCGAGCRWWWKMKPG
jgi:Mg2+-importing ATPase